MENVKSGRRDPELGDQGSHSISFQNCDLEQIILASLFSILLMHKKWNNNSSPCTKLLCALNSLIHVKHKQSNVSIDLRNTDISTFLKFSTSFFACWLSSMMSPNCLSGSLNLQFGGIIVVCPGERNFPSPLSLGHVLEMGYLELQLSVFNWCLHICESGWSILFLS